jgi:hypothetical protein
MGSLILSNGSECGKVILEKENTTFDFGFFFNRIDHKISC